MDLFWVKKTKLVRERKKENSSRSFYAVYLLPVFMLDCSNYVLWVHFHFLARSEYFVDTYQDQDAYCQLSRSYKIDASYETCKWWPCRSVSEVSIITSTSTQQKAHVHINKLRSNYKFDCVKLNDCNHVHVCAHSKKRRYHHIVGEAY